MATIKILKNSDLKELKPQRRLNSHKGQNGKVLIIGGSKRYHGAPIFAGLAAFAAGCDLVYLLVPACHHEVTKAASPNFIVFSYKENHLNTAPIEDLLPDIDAILIGPGLENTPETLSAVTELVKNTNSPIILDGSAISVLKNIKNFPLKQEILITPHITEFQNLVDRQVRVSEEDPKSIILLRSLAMDLHINILLKGREDYIISSEGHSYKNLTGHPGMTVGGTGDALAGLTAGYISQKVDPFSAAKISAFHFGLSGERLAKSHGNGYTATQLIDLFPQLAK